MIEIDNIYTEDCLDTMQKIEPKSINLIIADPPYYKVKGEFDFEFKSFNDYSAFMEKCAIGFKRILADNGSLFIFGHSKRIAYIQVLFDKYFHLENNAVWDKGSFMGLDKSNELRSFAPCSERILFYSNEINMTGLEFIEKKYIAPRNPFSTEIKNGMKKYNLKESDFRKLRLSKNGNHTGWCSNIILGSSNPTPKDWNLIKTLIKSDKEYEELRREYEELRRPFFNKFDLQEILRFPNEQTKTGAKYEHETVKPERLTRAIILTCSRENDLIYVPFVGSGTECAMAAKENRHFIGSEKVSKYVEIAKERVKKEKQIMTLSLD